MFREDLHPHVHLSCDFMFQLHSVVFNICSKCVSCDWPTLFIAYLICFVEMEILSLKSDFILFQAKYVSKVNETSKVNRNHFHSKNIFTIWEVTSESCSEKDTELGIRTPGMNPQSITLWLLAVKQTASLL